MLRLLLRTIGNILLVYLLDHYLSQYFLVLGGIPGYVIVGVLLTLLNLILRPILGIIAAPFKLIATLPTVILLNALFLWIIYQLTLRMDPSLVSLVISGGIWGWFVVSTIMGIANWVMRKVVG